MPPVVPIIAAVASVAAPIVAGAASVVGAAASAVGSVASGILGGAASLAGGAVSAVGGGISALTGGQAAVPVMVGGEMGSLAAVSEAAALGVPAATVGVATGLSTIMTGIGAGVGLYGQLADIEMAKEMTEAQKIAAQKGLMEAEALKIYAEGGAPAAPIPTLAAPAAQPVYVTPAAAPAAPNYLLYAGLAILAIFLFRKK